MKKLFTLVALLACFLGAKAEWVVDYSIDYSTKTGFPFYVMGYVPEWVDGVMTDYGANYRYETQENLDGDGDSKWKDGESSVGSTTTAAGVEYQKVTGAGPYWHQYFIADGIPTEIDGSYTVKAWVKASEAVTIDVNMGWGWGSGEQTKASVAIPQSDDFVEVEWEYSGIAGTSCNLVAQPGTATATIEWKSLTVSHNQKESKPTVWQEWLTSDGKPVVVETKSDAIPTFMGNAETPWADATVRFDDAEKNYLICAWGKENGVNVNGDGGSDPFPATIELEEGTQNHVFVVHAKDCTDPSADASAWDNQFWIESPKPWKEGEQLKIHFRYKASQNAKTNTQVHHQNPSNYQHWQAIGDITFTTEWQEFDKVVAWPNGAGDDAWSIAFNLNPEVKTATDFYFDDLSWQSMVLEEGYFVAGCNTDTGLQYDFDNAVSFVEDEDAGCLVAIVGEKGKIDTYVNQVMISTVCGNDAAFKSNTLKPSGSITNDPDNWLDYAASSLAKLTLPGSGVWKIYLDPAYSAMAFEMLEGTEKEAVAIVTNTTNVVVNGLEREPTASEQPADEEAGTPAGTGAAWDNQFFIVANREFKTGEKVTLKFKYKASKEAKTTTQLHGDPGAYIFWNAIGDVNFTTEWQDFEKSWEIAAGDNGEIVCKSIAFNMAEIKDACVYELKDFQWYLTGDENADGKTFENLINKEGTANFFVKEGAGTTPHEFVDPTGINEVAAKKNITTATYNLAGQRVSDSFKGIVIKDGKKFVK